MVATNVSNATDHAECDSEKQSAAEVRDLFAATFDLLNDEISGPQWLEKLAALAGCGSATCIWWPAGEPAKAQQDIYGRELDLDIGRLRALDEAIAAAAKEPGLLDELANKGTSLPAATQTSLFCPTQLVACIDWSPARVLIIFADRHAQENWLPEDRDRLNNIIPVIRKSVIVKKRLSASADALELSNKIIDEIPPGFVVVTPTREIISNNRYAQKLIAKGPPLQLLSGKLRICNPDFQREFQAHLDTISATSKDQLNELIWYKNISGTAEDGSLLATVIAFSFNHSRTESTPYDRAALIILEQQGLGGVPDTKQLMEFYRLTRAQARLLQAIMQGCSTEEAADKLYISINTARSHLRAIYARLGISNKGQLLQIVKSTVTGGIKHDT